ncbi:MAG: outer membrane beta-barrel protein [Deltaproteobacteria bacterium]|nr:outer membrane beta-barrel protein [Deltaproteobacteria bacterium]
MQNKSIIFAFILFISFWAFPVQALERLPDGQGNIKLGPLEVHPSISIKETYTDNVYLSYDGLRDRSDWITTVSPGIAVVLPLRRHSIKAGYQADINYYNKHDENDYVHQVAFASLNLDFPGGLTIEVSDRFTDSETVRKWKKIRGVSGAADPYRDKPYQANDFFAKAKYQFADRWAVATWYNFYNYEYDNRYNNTGDYDRHTVGGSLYYRLTAKTEALLEYSYSRVDYPQDDFHDNKNHTIYTGFGFDPTAKLSGYIKLGWTQKKYDDKRERRGSRIHKDDKIDEFSTQVDLAYKLTPYDTIKLKAFRAIEEDEDTNEPHTRDDYSIGYSHILSMNEKIRLNAILGYGKNDFDGRTFDTDGRLKHRNDDIYYATLGVDYAMQRWLLWNVGYTYMDRDSNFIRYDYDENRFFVKGTVHF